MPSTVLSLSVHFLVNHPDTLKEIFSVLHMHNSRLREVKCLDQGKSLSQPLVNQFYLLLSLNF